MPKYPYNPHDNESYRSTTPPYTPKPKVEPKPAPKPDMVNHPPHYKQFPVEVITITELLNFCLGNAVKYILRADFKGNKLEDLKKARWYLDREITNLERKG